MWWLRIASLALLGLVLAIFALIGLLYATRGTPARVVRDFGPAGPPAAGQADFIRSLELLTNTPVVAGHAIELLLDGNGTFPRLWQDLRAARRSITVQLYYCKPGAVADSLKDIVRDRAQAGVRVHMLFDAFGSQALPESYYDSLRAAGARVALFRPLHWYTLHKAQSRSHVRGVVIDDEIGYTGGFGIDDVWLGDGRSTGQWRETNVRFTGPAVAQLKAAFAVSWAEATGVLITSASPDSGAPRAQAVPGVHAGVLISRPGLGSSQAELLVMLSIAGARERLWITNSYFIPDDELCGLLAGAARRGVDVRVLTAGPRTDVAIVRRAAHAKYTKLLRAGVHIFEYQPTMIHAKTIVIDGIFATVGTMNFDTRSLAFNDESNLVVMDTTFARRLEEIFVADLRRAREFTLPEFSQRSLFTKLVDAVAGQLAQLL